ncbi:MAG: hypothetical protein ACP5GU_02765 [Thermoprotei archaeon]
MSLNLTDLQKLIRDKGIKVTIFFKGQRYGIVIHDIIFPIEKMSGRRVDWFKAFGLKRPEDVIHAFPVDYILYEAKGKEEIIKSIKELEDKLKHKNI